ncbi:hypothetical protein L1887_00830 [Cichorium endivia]|nr:hypothetical protein L1887_00830 [Cichorium endivia]
MGSPGSKTFFRQRATERDRHTTSAPHLIDVDFLELHFTRRIKELQRNYRGKFECPEAVDICPKTLKRFHTLIKLSRIRFIIGSR